MKRYKIAIILAISLLVTTGLFIHEYLYDKPGYPYSLQQTLEDIFIGGAMFTGVFFAIIFGLYTAVERVYAMWRKKRLKS